MWLHPLKEREGKLFSCCLILSFLAMEVRMNDTPTQLCSFTYFCKLIWIFLMRFKHNLTFTWKWNRQDERKTFPSDNEGASSGYWNRFEKKLKSISTNFLLASDAWKIKCDSIEWKADDFSTIFFLLVYFYFLKKKLVSITVFTSLPNVTLSTNSVSINLIHYFLQP